MLQSYYFINDFRDVKGVSMEDLKKWEGAGDDPFESEEKIESLVAPDSFISAEIDAYIDRNITEALDRGRKAEWEAWTQRKIERMLMGKDETVNKKFFAEFISYLLGKIRPDSPEFRIISETGLHGTGLDLNIANNRALGWNIVRDPPISSQGPDGEEIRAYIKTFTDRHFQMIQKTLDLKIRGPRTLREHWLFFKYIVKGHIKDFGTRPFPELFLDVQDWMRPNSNYNMFSERRRGNRHIGFNGYGDFINRETRSTRDRNEPLQNQTRTDMLVAANGNPDRLIDMIERYYSGTGPADERDYIIRRRRRVPAGPGLGYRGGPPPGPPPPGGGGGHGPAAQPPPPPPPYQGPGGNPGQPPANPNPLHPAAGGGGGGGPVQAAPLAANAVVHQINAANVRQELQDLNQMFRDSAQEIGKATRSMRQELGLTLTALQKASTTLPNVDFSGFKKLANQVVNNYFNILDQEVLKASNNRKPLNLPAPQVILDTSKVPQQLSYQAPNIILDTNNIPSSINVQAPNVNVLPPLTTTTTTSTQNNNQPPPPPPSTGTAPIVVQANNAQLESEIKENTETMKKLLDRLNKMIPPGQQAQAQQTSSLFGSLFSTGPNNQPPPPPSPPSTGTSTVNYNVNADVQQPIREMKEGVEGVVKTATKGVEETMKKSFKTFVEIFEEVDKKVDLRVEEIKLLTQKVEEYKHDKEMLDKLERLINVLDNQQTVHNVQDVYTKNVASETDKDVLEALSSNVNELLVKVKDLGIIMENVNTKTVSIETAQKQSSASASYQSGRLFDVQQTLVKVDQILSSPSFGNNSIKLLLNDMDSKLSTIQNNSVDLTIDEYREIQKQIKDISENVKKRGDFTELEVSLETLLSQITEKTKIAGEHRDKIAEMARILPDLVQKLNDYLEDGNKQVLEELKGDLKFFKTITTDIKTFDVTIDKKVSELLTTVSVIEQAVKTNETKGDTSEVVRNLNKTINEQKYKIVDIETELERTKSEKEAATTLTSTQKETYINQMNKLKNTIEKKETEYQTLAKDHNDNCEVINVLEKQIELLKAEIERVKNTGSLVERQLREDLAEKEKRNASLTERVRIEGKKAVDLDLELKQLKSQIEVKDINLRALAPRPVEFTSGQDPKTPFSLNTTTDELNKALGTATGGKHTDIFEFIQPSLKPNRFQGDIDENFTWNNFSYDMLTKVEWFHLVNSVNDTREPEKVESINKLNKFFTDLGQRKREESHPDKEYRDYANRNRNNLMTFGNFQTDRADQQTFDEMEISNTNPENWDKTRSQHVTARDAGFAKYLNSQKNSYELKLSDGTTLTFGDRLSFELSLITAAKEKHFENYKRQLARDGIEVPPGFFQELKLKLDQFGEKKTNEVFDTMFNDYIEAEYANFIENTELAGYYHQIDLDQVNIDSGLRELAKASVLPDYGEERYTEEDELRQMITYHKDFKDAFEQSNMEIPNQDHIKRMTNLRRCLVQNIILQTLNKKIDNPYTDSAIVSLLPHQKVELVTKVINNFRHMKKNGIPVYDKFIDYGTKWADWQTSIKNSRVPYMNPKDRENYLIDNYQKIIPSSIKPSYDSMKSMGFGHNEVYKFVNDFYCDFSTNAFFSSSIIDNLISTKISNIRYNGMMDQLLDGQTKSYIKLSRRKFITQPVTQKETSELFNSVSNELLSKMKPVSTKKSRSSLDSERIKCPDAARRLFSPAQKLIRPVGVQIG